MPFPDALAAAAEAGTVPGPVLQVNTSDALNASTKAELKRLAPDRIVVLGGTGAVSNSVYKLLMPLAKGQIAATTARIATPRPPSPWSCRCQRPSLMCRSSPSGAKESHRAANPSHSATGNDTSGRDRPSRRSPGGPAALPRRGQARAPRIGGRCQRASPRRTSVDEHDTVTMSKKAIERRSLRNFVAQGFKPA